MTPELVNGLFAVVGAIVGAGFAAYFSWIQHKKVEKRQELTFISSQPVRLVAIDQAISNVVEVLVHGKKVPTVFTIDITILNSGTQLVSDIKAPLRLSPAAVVAANIATPDFSPDRDSGKVSVSDSGIVIVE